MGKVNNLRRALSVSDLMAKNYKTFAFEGPWYEAFGEPETTGVWFIWGGSGNGKSRFVIQLVKELSKFGRVHINPLEEGTGLTLQNAFRDTGIGDVKRKITLLNEPMTDLTARLLLKKSPEFVVVDSFQYTMMTYAQYIKFKEQHRNKLIIFTSHADGKNPAGRSSKSVMYDADLKIRVEGYKALSKGRFIGPNGGQYTIWDEGAYRYWNEI